MKIAFLGKGGSGKSTLSTAYSLFQSNNDYNILAIDADYNMDLTHNLCDYFKYTNTINKLGDNARFYLREKLKVDKVDFNKVVNDKLLNFNFNDEFTNKFALKFNNNLKLLTVGDPNDAVLDGDMCTHGLSATLRAYLPLYSFTNKNEQIVLDEKAGTDSVSNSIARNYDLSVIVFEPTLYGIKAAKQISEILLKFNQKYIFVMNKAKDKDIDAENIKNIENDLGGKISVIFAFSPEIEEKSVAELANIINVIK